MNETNEQAQLDRIKVKLKNGYAIKNENKYIDAFFSRS